MTDLPYLLALSQLYGLARFGEKLDLSTPRALQAALGWPVRFPRAVLVGGTNGKGSTCAFLEAVLRRAGVRTGLFTSPHLVSFRERIRVDGEDIDEQTMYEAAFRVLGVAGEAGLEPSFFEVAHAMASVIFAEAGVDVAIWEVGLGGRLDATNVCHPEASAVVTVDLDHQDVLGHTLAEIAREKAAIFRPGRPALTAASGAALAALRAATPGQLAVVQPSDDLPDLPLPGAHQRHNAALALALASCLGVEPDPDALQDVRWPGRAERIGNVILDCAHNPAGAAALADFIRDRVRGPIHLVFGAMAGKDVAGVIALLEPLVSSVAVVTPQYPRRLEASALVPLFTQVPAWDAGTVEDALSALPADRLTLVTGSCFLVGEARALMMGQEFPEGGLLTMAR
ncbi:MAG: cyanophycin synthetase [bacterium]